MQYVFLRSLKAVHDLWMAGGHGGETGGIAGNCGSGFVALAVAPSVASFSAHGRGRILRRAAPKCRGRDPGTSRSRSQSWFRWHPWLRSMVEPSCKLEKAGGFARRRTLETDSRPCNFAHLFRTL